MIQSSLLISLENGMKKTVMISMIVASLFNDTNYKGKMIQEPFNH